MALYGNEQMVEAMGARFKKECLIAQKSILTGVTLWTVNNFRELYRLYNESPDETNRSFDVKVQDQLREASSEARQLFAEIYILDLLVLGNVLPDTKIQKINAILEHCKPPMSLDGEGAPEGAASIVQTFRAGGVLNGGQGYNMGRWRQMQYLIELGCAWSTLPSDERQRMMATAEGVEKALTSLATKNEPQIIYALAYLLDPQAHVPITSRGNLTQITEHFGDRLQEDEKMLSLQRQASIIQHKVREERGEGWGFYDDAEEWSSTKNTPSDVEADGAGDLGSQLAAEIPAGGEEPFRLPKFPDEAADSLLVGRSWLDEVHRTLDRRKQIIFQGPPGTGKTYLARRIATKLAGSAERVALVQFHPAYTYEDFFEGFRPNPNGGLELRHGPLRRLAGRAESEPEFPFFLVVDEMNRGNLARIFGELYFLLEYRDQRLDLMYSQEKFTLPENLFIIGTMNSADRSIALVDSAMRRRFGFIDFEPSKEPTRNLLARWCTQHGVDPAIARLWVTLNERIEGMDCRAVLGPTYFMRDWVYVNGGLEDLWRTEIMPQLREGLFGHDASEIADLELAIIRSLAEVGE